MAEGKDAPESIALAILNGDRNAEALLYNKYHRPLLYILMRKCRNLQHAQDLCQETFEIAIIKLRAEGIDNPKKLSSYLHGIALNLFRNGMRGMKNSDHFALETDQIESEIPSPSSEIDTEEVRACVRAMIQKIKNNGYREILYRYYVCDWDKSTICKSLDLDTRHFDKVIYLAKKQFRNLFLKTAKGQEIQDEIVS